jgi:hypothetical protein
MSGIFSKPTMPTVPDPIRPPTTDDARQAEEDMLRLRRRRGLASTFLARGGSRMGAAGSLLGSGGGSSGGGGVGRGGGDYSGGGAIP